MFKGCFRNFVFLIFCFLFTAGCASTHAGRLNYSFVDKNERKLLVEVMEIFLEEYLPENKDIDEDVDRAKILAYREILKTSFAKKYEITQPIVDADPGIKNAAQYIFVHFHPREIDNNNYRSTYLVVIQRFYGREVYHGEFIFPSGAAIYKYGAILNHLNS